MPSASGWPRRAASGAAEMAVSGGPAPQELLTPRSLPQCHRCHAGDRRLDQRHHPSHRDRQPNAAWLRSRHARRDRSQVPVLVDLKPSGAHYMEHFHHAGGVPRLLAQLGDLIDLDARHHRGSTLRRDCGRGRGSCPGRTSSGRAQQSDQGRRLHGGALRQPRPGRGDHQALGRDARLLQHTGRAVVFDSVEDMAARIDDPDLDVTADDVLVLRNTGPKGAPACRKPAICRSPKSSADRA
jgi:dihydroxy-acid dehydratase